MTGRDRRKWDGDQGDGDRVAELLTVEDLKVTFSLPEGRLEAVRGISFSVDAGSTVALVGESGSGKSVVSQAIMGILPTTAKIEGGSIRFADPASGGQVIDLAKLDPRGSAYRSLRGGRMSIIFQEPMTSLSPVHTVGNQVIEALELHRKVSHAEAAEIAKQMLAHVGFPDAERALKTFPFELSGGLRQRAMIAMALVCRPALLIADEPTTALDVTIQAQILKLLRDLQSELQMALLLITHDLGVVANMAEEVVVMYHGEVMERGPASTLFAAPSHPYLKALLHAVPRFDMKPGERLTPLREIPTKASGQLMRARSAGGKPEDASVALLDVQSITKRFRLRAGRLFGKATKNEVLAVDNVGFKVMRGECLGLVGESGCGKTTLSKIIMRALTPDEGSISFNSRGERINVLGLKGSDLVKFRPRVQFIFQDPYSSLNPRMTVGDIVREPLDIHNVGTKEERQQMVVELLNVVGLKPHHAKRYPHSFSGGQRQRIGIARALALRPEFIICDEPVSALDVSIQAQILNLLKDLQAQLGLTYLFVSHNLAVVNYIADRIMVMCKGRIVELATTRQLFRNPLHPYTKALLAAVPEPRLENKLDLAALMAGRASDPAAWPEPFTIDRDRHPDLIEVEPGHFVRASVGERQAA
jgi:peptide/nickel transport system ATP-binding protein